MVDSILDSINFDPGHEKYIQYKTIPTFMPEMPNLTTKLRHVTIIVIGEGKRSKAGESPFIGLPRLR